MICWRCQLTLVRIQSRVNLWLGRDSAHHVQYPQSLLLLPPQAAQDLLHYMARLDTEVQYLDVIHDPEGMWVSLRLTNGYWFEGEPDYISWWAE